MIPAPAILVTVRRPPDQFASNGKDRRRRNGRRAGRGLPLLVVVGLLLLSVLVSITNLPTSPGTPSLDRTAGPTLGVAGPITVPSAQPTGSGFPTPIQHVIVIMMENQEETAVERYGAFEASLAGNYSSDSQFFSVRHASLHDYLAATSGADAYRANLTIPNVGDLAEQAGLTWATFQESMPAPCGITGLGENSTSYNFEHNPFLYYQDVAGNRSRCVAHDLPLTQWYADVNASDIPNYSWITPNNTDDDHTFSPSCTTERANATIAEIECGDAWLRRFLTPVIQDPAVFAHTVIFITYDEALDSDHAPYGTGGGHIYLAAVSPYSRPGYVSTIPADTYNILTTTEWLLGLAHTGTNQNDNWSLYPPMMDLFNFTTSFPVSGTVTDPAAQPIAGAFLNNSVGNLTTTNTAGEFTLYLPNGTYELAVNSSGYETSDQFVTVSGSAISGLDVVLTACTICVGAPMLSPTSSGAIGLGRSILDVGQYLSITVPFSGGSGGYTFAWSGLPHGCPATTAAFVCKMTTAGVLPVNVTIRDSHGDVTTSPTSEVTVEPDPTETPFSFSVPSGQLWAGQEVVFTNGSVSNGDGPYGFQWSGLPTGCWGGGLPTDPCLPTAGGTFNVTLEAFDSNGLFVNVTRAYTVLPAVVVDLSPAKTFVDLGQWVTLHLNASGGSGGYSFAWSGLPPGCPSTNGTLVTCQPTATGSFSVSATVRDSVNVSTSIIENLTVYADPEVPAPVVSLGVAYVGEAVNISVEVREGHGPYYVVWSGLPSNCSPGSSESFVCAPGAEGTYNVSANVTDATGFSARSNATELRVIPMPQTSSPVTGSAGPLQAATVAAAVSSLVAVIVISLRRPRSRSVVGP
jgi:hypothetical protein